MLGQWHDRPINTATHHIILKIVRFKLSNAKQALDDKNWLNWNTVSRVCPLPCPELWRRDQTQSLCFQRPDRLHSVRFFILNPIASRSTSLLVAHPCIFRLFMKEKFNSNVLWPFAQNWNPTIFNIIWWVDGSMGCWDIHQHRLMVQSLFW